MTSDGTGYSVLSGRSVDAHLAILASGGAAFPGGVAPISYALTDAVNSTVMTASNVGATLVFSPLSYDPYGQTSSSSTYPFQFTGRMPVTGSLLYYRARYYEPALGRFIGEDPLRVGNLYQYASDSPIQSRDPFGLCASSSLTFTEETQITKVPPKQDWVSQAAAQVGQETAGVQKVATGVVGISLAAPVAVTAVEAAAPAVVAAVSRVALSCAASPLTCAKFVVSLFGLITGERAGPSGVSGLWATGLVPPFGSIGSLMFVANTLMSNGKLHGISGP